MLDVSIRKVESIEDDNVKNTEVLIKVTLNTPILGAEPYLGIFFKNAPKITLSETTLPFSDMKKVMDQHNLKNWGEVKKHIEDKYSKYYLQVFQSWNVEEELKNRDS